MTLPSLSRRNLLIGAAGIAAVGGGISAAGVAPVPAPAHPVKTAPVELLECFIAGTQHHAFDALKRQMPLGMKLKIVREPHNPHDANAIAIHAFGQRIGYIPRQANRALSKRLDSGLPTSIVLADLPTGLPWEQALVQVWGG